MERLVDELCVFRTHILNVCFNLKQIDSLCKPIRSANKGNTNMTKWTHLIYLSIIAVLSYLLWQESAAITQPAQQQVNPLPLTTDSQLTASQGTQHQIEREITVDTIKHSEVEVAEVDVTDHSAPTAPPPRTEYTSLQYTDAEVAELLKKAINVDKVKELIQTEAIDQDWAYAMQENLQLLYDKNESLHRATLNYIECFTTVCEVQFTNTDAPIDFMSSFHQKMVQEHWYSERYQSVMMTDSETQTQTFYIVKMN